MTPDEDLQKLEIQVARLQEKVEARDKALTVQAKEYERRLHDLNGEYKRDRERQTDFVSIDKYEDKIAAMDEARTTAVEAEKMARETALQRVDEKFIEYVKKWEQIQAEQAATIVTLSQAAAEAKRIAEDQGRQTRAEAETAARRQKDEQQEAARRQTRNITLMGIGLAFIVGLANILPGIL